MCVCTAHLNTVDVHVCHSQSHYFTVVRVSRRLCSTRGFMVKGMKQTSVPHFSVHDYDFPSSVPYLVKLEFL